MHNKTTMIYKGTTALFSLFMLFGAGMYFFQYDTVAEMFGGLGFPAFIIYPLAIAKIAGLIPLWSKKMKTLREWAYAGYVYVFILGLLAHLNAGDGQYIGVLIALVLVLLSYHFSKKIYGRA